ncbi:MAG: hypothetical protein KAV87_19695 [Desulfobacteraceae bacterium]|nr:hypothetical protein [Desulfobacteraceae bacterium]
MKKSIIIMRRETLRVIIAVFIVTLLISLSTGVAYAFEVPKLPHAFYGDILINGSPAPIDTKVEVAGPGVMTGVSGNPLYTTEIGKYGESEALGVKLLAQGGTIEDATTLTFYVNDISTGQTLPFQSGNITELDLIIPSAPPPESVNSLTTSSTDGGHVETPGEAGPYYYPPDFDAPLLAVPDDCFVFVEWTGDIGTVENVTTAETFITMSDNYTITAVFDLTGIEIPFNAGWNTFSTPVILHDCMDTWDEFIAFNGLQVSMIYGYDSATESWVEPDGADEILCGHGYYVKAAEAAVAHTAPDPGAALIPLSPLSRGVHLIGTPQLVLEDIDVASALTTLYEAMNGHIGYVLVVSPYINGPNDWEYIRDGSDPPIMTIGRAYWVVIENDSWY